MTGPGAGALPQQQPAGPAASLPPTGLAAALLSLARGERTDLAALLHDVEVQTVVDGTRVTFHCHSVALDARGRPRLTELAAAVCERALEFAIPRSEIARAQEHMDRTGSPARIIRLHNQALELFTDIENSGEGGELLLFVLAEALLRLPQVLCKMSLKTNPRMHVHGADGVHAGVDPDTGRLALYWGESKLYGDPAAAIRECLASIAPMLLNCGPGTAHERDLQLLHRNVDLDDPQLEAALKPFLDPRDPAFNEIEFRGLCLVGFDCDVYPAAIDAMRQPELIAAILGRTPTWKAQIARRIREEGLDVFSLHMICVPFPSAEDFRTYMRQALGIGGRVAA
ncbi:MAG: hypothetical protein JWL60_1128 [Gemmatimonadetes bacterium]|jgi:hypothetical protein|nr:hypothetical protein [Gemmatimonadota bacterium]